MIKDYPLKGVEIILNRFLEVAEDIKKNPEKYDNTPKIQPVIKL